VQPKLFLKKPIITHVMSEKIKKRTYKVPRKASMKVADKP
jgi:hypothetical protein